MNARSPFIRSPEMHASTLESFSGQRASTETYARARELRRFIAEHPGCTPAEMPEELRSYRSFLEHKKLVTWRGNSPRRYQIRPL